MSLKTEAFVTGSDRKPLCSALSYLSLVTFLLNILASANLPNFLTSKAKCSKTCVWFCFLYSAFQAFLVRLLFLLRIFLGTIATNFNVHSLQSSFFL